MLNEDIQTRLIGDITTTVYRGYVCIETKLLIAHREIRLLLPIPVVNEGIDFKVVFEAVAEKIIDSIKVNSSTIMGTILLEECIGDKRYTIAASADHNSEDTLLFVIFVLPEVLKNTASEIDASIKDDILVDKLIDKRGLRPITSNEKTSFTLGGVSIKTEVIKLSGGYELLCTSGLQKQYGYEVALPIHYGFSVQQPHRLTTLSVISRLLKTNQRLLESATANGDVLKVDVRLIVPETKQTGTLEFFVTKLNLDSRELFILADKQHSVNSKLLQ